MAVGVLWTNLNNELNLQTKIEDGALMMLLM